MFLFALESRVNHVNHVKHVNLKEGNSRVGFLLEPTTATRSCVLALFHGTGRLPVPPWMLEV